MSALPATMGDAGGSGARMIKVRGAGPMQALEREWKQLSRVSRPANPFLSWEWQRSWVETGMAALPGAEPWIVAATEGGRMYGLLALQCVRRHGMTQLEFLGQGAGGDELDCLLHPSAPAGTAAKLLRAGLRQGRWDLLRLETARADTGLVGALAGCVEGAWTQPGEWLPYLDLGLDLGRDLGTLLQRYRANFRAQIRRRRRGLERAAPTLRLSVAEGGREIDDGLEILFRLHAQRRAQRGGAAAFTTRAEREFHRRAAARLAVGGGVRLYQMRTATAVIATLYGFAADGCFYYFQSGFDPAWTAYSPGTVLMSLVLEDCMGRGERRFEFLRGDEYYKSRWTQERRRTVNLRGHRGLAGAAHARVAAWARRWRAPGEYTAEAA